MRGNADPNPRRAPLEKLRHHICKRVIGEEKPTLTVVKWHRAEASLLIQAGEQRQPDPGLLSRLDDA